MADWYMLSVIGKDRPGIVAGLTRALYDGGCNLGEASMLRLGDSFAVMLMARHEGDPAALEALVQPVARELDLQLRVDPVEGHAHGHAASDVRIAVFGADRAGIVAEVTGVLAGAGLNIVDLRSDVARGKEGPLYILQIEGQALQGIEALRRALAESEVQGLDVHVEPIDLLIG